MFSTLFAAARFLTPFAISLTLAAAPAPARHVPHAPASGQDEQEAVVRVSTELVQTDVMVFDRNGKFVEGLKPEQFELKVDGQTQPVSFFELIEAGAFNEDAQLAAARGGARTTAQPSGVSVPLDRGRTVAFFIDDLHLSPEGAVRTRRAVRKFVEEELGQNDVAAVLSATGKVGFLQQYTSHRGVLRAAAERIAPAPSRAPDIEQPPITEAMAAAVERNESPVINALVQIILRENPMMPPGTAENLVRGRARNIMERANHFTGLTLQSLEAMVRRAGQLPGRKIVFFISEGFVYNETNSQVRDRMRRVADAAARSGVVIYSMDAQGLRTSGSDTASSQRVFDPSMALVSNELGEVAAYQAPLVSLAAETGGRALINSNSLTAGVSNTLKETAKYYLLAWRPEPSDGKGGSRFRRVEVAVKGRSDLRVIVRRGFYSTPPEPLTPPKRKGGGQAEAAAAAAPAPVKTGPPAERELQAALSAPQPLADLPTALALGYTNTEQAGNILTSSVELSRDALLRLTDKSTGRHHFDVLGMVFDQEGKVVKGFKQEISFVGQFGDAPGGTRVVASHQAVVPPGLYQVRVAARARESGRTGSAVEWVEIPDLKREKLTLGSVFLYERVARPEAEDDEDSEEGGGAESPRREEEDGTLGVITADRRFARSSWLRFLTHVYSPAATAAPDLALQIQVFRDDQPVFTAPLRKIPTQGLTDLTRVPYAAEVTLSDFPAGRYVLHLTAIDRASKQSATQRVAFVIE